MTFKTASESASLVVFLLLALPTLSLAQEGTVSGEVIGETGEPVATATVEVVGTQIGTLTDESGRFTINLAPGEYNLRVRIIGFNESIRTVTVRAGETTTVRFELSARAVELDELVASVSARTQRRVELGTDIERVDAEEAVDRGAVSNLPELLTGRATGVSVNESSGQTGSASTINVRGRTSLTQDNTPIVYVDGARVSNSTSAGPISFDFGSLGSQTISRLDDFNPEDVSSVQVMKGPTAAAVYGSEAAAGVLVIETKSGSPGTPRVTVSTEQGWNEDFADYRDNYHNLTSVGGVTDVSNPDFQQWSPVENPVSGEVFARDNPLLNDRTRPFRRGHIENYNVSLRGGVDEVTYFSSIRFQQEDGVLPNNGLRRMSLRGNFEAQPSEDVSVSLSTFYVDSDIQVPHNDHSAFGMITNGEAGFPLYSFGRNADGSRGDCLATLLLGEPESACTSQEGNLTTTFDNLKTLDNGEELGRFVGSMTTRWVPSDWLTNRVTLGVDHRGTKTWQFVPVDSDRPFGDHSAGFRIEERRNGQTYTIDAASTASASLSDEVDASLTLGGQYINTNSETTGCTGEGGFASNTATACDAALSFTGYSSLFEIIEFGGFAQQQLSYRDYLFFTGALRIDDNSGFGEEQSAIFSPSASFSSVLTDMPFWNWELVSNLRFRLAWGTAAQAPSAYAHARTFRPVRVEENGQQLTGVTPADPGNPRLAPERNEEFELGFDGGILDDRLSFKLTYFNQTTTDAIVSTTVAKSSGFEGSQFVNVGEVENEGFEALLSGQILRSDNVVWDAQLSYSAQDPVVTSLGDEPPILQGGTNGMIREGYAPGAKYGPVIGSAERDENGDIIAESVEFLPGNIVDGSNDRYMGVGEPTNRQSLSTTLTLFGNLRFYTLFDRAAGHVKYDGTTAYLSPFIPGLNVSRKWALRHVESTPEEQAAMEMGGAASRFVFMSDADFVKWRELTVRYQLNSDQLPSFLGRLDGLGIALGARNLHTWTDYMGLDPESREDGGEDTFGQGVFFTQPPGRRFFGRVTVTF